MYVIGLIIAIVIIVAVLLAICIAIKKSKVKKQKAKKTQKETNVDTDYYAKTVERGLVDTAKRAAPKNAARVGKDLNKKPDPKK